MKSVKSKVSAFYGLVQVITIIISIMLLLATFLFIGIINGKGNKVAKITKETLEITKESAKIEMIERNNEANIKIR